MEIEIGLRVYNRGDMANPEHWGTITRIIENKQFGDQVEITPEPDAKRKPYTVYPVMISHVDEGHGGTRIVTERAHEMYRQKQIERMNAFINKYQRTEVEK